MFPFFKRALSHLIGILPGSEVDGGNGKRREEEEEDVGRRKVLELQRLQLCLNSLSADPNSGYLYEVLRLTEYARTHL